MRVENQLGLANLAELPWAELVLRALGAKDVNKK